MGLSLDDLDVAVAHWHVRAWGGAEYLVTHLADILEVDRVHTIGDPDPEDSNPYGDVEWVDIVDGLSPRPLRRLQSRVGRVFEYAIWEDVDWRAYGPGEGAPDVLVTSGSTARAVITPDDTLHVNYCHSPPRWFYDLYHDRKDSLKGVLTRPLVRHLRTRDVAIDPRVDHYLANSPIIERRLWKYYKRESEVLYPPIDVERYRYEGDDGFYLHLGRLDREKGVPAVVAAFEELDERLVMAGGMGDIGDDTRVRINRADNIDWRGFVGEDEKFDLLSRCTAVVFNGQNEDFGIVPIEANASGKPVLARDEGFPGIYIREGENGYLHDGTVKGIRDAIDRSHSGTVEADAMSVEQFSYEAFGRQLHESLGAAYRRTIDGHGVSRT